MKKLYLIGNLTADPVMRTTVTGVPVCSFTVAVNYRVAGEQRTDFYRVSAWRTLGSSCGEYLQKGSKVAVIGEFSTDVYTGKDGKSHVSVDVTADTVEFLGATKRASGNDGGQDPAADGFTDIDKLPFD